MATKTRIPNKVIWALEDILALSYDSRRDWSRALEYAQKAQDPGLLLALARLRDSLARIEQIARLARQGEYRGGLNGRA